MVQLPFLRSRRPSAPASPQNSRLELTPGRNCSGGRAARDLPTAASPQVEAPVGVPRKAPDPKKMEPESDVAIKIQPESDVTQHGSTEEDFLDLIFLREGEEENTSAGQCRGGGGSLLSHKGPEHLVGGETRRTAGISVMSGGQLEVKLSESACPATRPVSVPRKAPDPKKMEPESDVAIKIQPESDVTQHGSTEEDFLDLVFLREGEDENTSAGQCRGGGGSQRPQWQTPAGQIQWQKLQNILADALKKSGLREQVKYLREHIAAKIIIDFSFRDLSKNGLHLSEADALFERSWVYEIKGAGGKTRLILHGHTFRSWNKRKSYPAKVRANYLTSANWRLADQTPTLAWEQDAFGDTVLPRDRDLRDWRSYYNQPSKHKEIEWNWREDDLPRKEGRDQNNLQMYNKIKILLTLADGMEIAETLSKKQTNRRIRGGNGDIADEIEVHHLKENLSSQSAGHAVLESIQPSPGIPTLEPSRPHKPGVAVKLTHTEAQSFWEENFPGEVSVTWAELHAALKEDFADVIEGIVNVKYGLIGLQKKLDVNGNDTIMLMHFNIFTKKNGVRGTLQKFYESLKQNPDASVAAEGTRALVAFEGGTAVSGGQGVVGGGQAGRIGGGLDSNAIQKGGIYWYRDTSDGVEKQVEVVAIDRSVQPPSIAIRVDGRERETEAHRLSLHQSSLQSLSGGLGSVHDAVPVDQRVVFELQQMGFDRDACVKAAVSCNNDVKEETGDDPPHGPKNEIIRHENHRIIYQTDGGSICSNVKSPKVFRVLFLGANNRENQELALETEVINMQAEFRKKHGNDLWKNASNFHYFRFADYDTMKDEVGNQNPHVIHVSCHGEAGKLELLGTELDVDKLSEILRVQPTAREDDMCQLIILNACNSDETAYNLWVKLGYSVSVVGHTGTVFDSAAVCFSGNFYKSLGELNSFEDAFKAGAAAAATAGSEKSTKYVLYASRHAMDFKLQKPKSADEIQKEEETNRLQQELAVERFQQAERERQQAEQQAERERQQAERERQQTLESNRLQQELAVERLQQAERERQQAEQQAERERQQAERERQQALERARQIETFMEGNNWGKRFQSSPDRRQNQNVCVHCLKPSELHHYAAPEWGSFCNSLDRKTYENQDGHSNVATTDMKAPCKFCLRPKDKHFSEWLQITNMAHFTSATSHHQS
jgi:hypothetical protein